MTQTKRVLAAVGLVATTAIAYSPMHTGGVARAATQTQTVRDLIRTGHFVAANGAIVPILASAPQRTISRHSNTASSASVKANSALIVPGNGTYANVRANQDFGAFVPHQTAALAQEPLNSLHLTAVAEDTRLGAGPFVSVPNAYTGFYNTNDGGKTFTDGLVQNIANDPNGLYPSVLGGGVDLIHGHYSYSDVPRAAFDKFGNLYVSSSAVVNNFYDSRNLLSDVLVTRSSAYQNTGGAAGPCPRALTTAFTCAFDNPTNPLTSVSATPGSSGRFFDGEQISVAPGSSGLPAGIPYVVDTNDAAALVGGAFGPAFMDDAPNIAVDNGPAGSQMIYVTWTRVNVFGPRSGTSDIMFASSANGGQTFSAPVNIDPTMGSTCVNVLASEPGTCDVNSGSYPVVDPQTNSLVVVFESFDSVGLVPGTGIYPANHQILEVTCTACVGGGNNFGANGVTYVSSVVDVAGAFSAFGSDPDNGAFFIANSYPSAAADPLDGSIDVVWSDARPNLRLCTSVPFAGAACGGGRVWEAEANEGGAVFQVLSGGASDADQLFPSITEGFNATVGELTYVTFYTRSDAAGTDPYGVGVGNSQLNYTVTRNEAADDTSDAGLPAEAVNANSSPMPLPLVNGGQILTKYTQSVADPFLPGSPPLANGTTLGVHSIFVDTRGNVKNFNFNGAEDLTSTYIR